ncbi:MAG: hypothetical protein ACT4QC_17480 [Planctomycetaceae bacterium]
MLSPLRSGLALALFAAVAPVAWQSDLVAGWRDCCCGVCYQPCGYCSCPAAPQTALQPVVETQFAQRPVWQQRDVTSTEYRAEPVAETVPTTIYENVMVDEGSYQTVWVPRLTTKAVAKTVYQTRTTYRSVPYQVTRRVAECNLASVPYQTVRYVPATAGSLVSSVMPGATVSSLPYTYTLPSTTIAGAPVTPSIVSSTVAAGPVPEPKFSSTASTPIAPRAGMPANATAGRAAGVERTADNGPALFSPAPSAAQVWRTPRGSVIR